MQFHALSHAAGGLRDPQLPAQQQEVAAMYDAKQWRCQLADVVTIAKNLLRIRGALTPLALSIPRPGCILVC